MIILAYVELYILGITSLGFQICIKYVQYVQYIDKMIITASIEMHMLGT
jgi:hypothetical protein